MIFLVLYYLLSFWYFCICVFVAFLFFKWFVLIWNILIIKSEQLCRH